ncbi:hypothetical protein [Actinoallomurus sp. NPDC050550]|uniref:hypothetical protein n=1 Tax=Actinoallomurus sp. NPDC050550 TaxID=3154937 RepID=UPI003402E598
MRMSPNHRRAVIQGLRELADELAVNRDLPVPLIIEIDYHPHGANDTEIRAEINRIAELINVTPETSANGENYRAVRRFGPIQYKAVTVSAREMARWEALLTYSENVNPDDGSEQKTQ